MPRPSLWKMLLVPVFAFSIPRGSAQHMNAPDAPCKTAGLDPTIAQCLANRFHEQDRELNRTYQQILRNLGPDESEKLKAAQRLWIQFRDAECTAEGNLYAGGSARPMVEMACSEAETRHRIRDLKDGFWWRVEK